MGWLPFYLLHFLVALALSKKTRATCGADFITINKLKMVNLKRGNEIGKM